MRLVLAVSCALFCPAAAPARSPDYPYAPYNEGKMDPQLEGWPLTVVEIAWVSKEEYSRKPGHEVQRHLPQFWTVTPTAAHWKPRDGSAANNWITHYGALVEEVQAMKADIDIALIGDSITQGWGGGYVISPAHIIQADVSPRRVETFIGLRVKHGSYLEVPPQKSTKPGKGGHKEEWRL